MSEIRNGMSVDWLLVLKIGR